MLEPLRIVESEREGFDEPVVELWRDDEFVGMVFWDDDVAVVQIYPDDSGDVFDLDVADLQRVLDMAVQIVTPPDFLEGGLDDIAARLAADGNGSADENPAILALTTEFDPLARHRDPDGGEGFFDEETAAALIARADELDVAVVELEGLDLVDGELRPRPNQHMLIRTTQAVAWPDFRAQANAHALETLRSWPSRETLVVSFVVQAENDEPIVL